MSTKRVLIAITLVIVLAPLFVFGSGAIQSAYNLIQNSGTPLAMRQTLNFTGSGVSCADAAPATTCTITAGTGTVISFSSGNLSPLFSTTVATATTTPALSFSLSNAGADTIFGNNTGSTAAPAFNSISSYLDTFGSAQGDILYRGSSGWTVLTPGTSGQFLKTQGASANPLWASAATSPCTTEASSLQYDNSGAFGCVAQVTYTSPVLTYLITGLGTTEQDAIFFQNTTAAASGAQQISPAIHFEGQGWKTTATAGSEAVDIYINAQPVQDTTNPDVMVPIYAGINGSVRTNPIAYFCANGTGSSSQVGLFGLDGQGGGVGCSIGSPGETGFGNLGSAGGVIAVMLGGTVRMNLNTTPMFVLGSATGLAWYSGSTANGTTGDTGLCRAAAGELLIYNGTACGTTAANMRDIELRSIVAGGSTPTISGCSAGTQTGGATAGTYASGTSGTCAVTITFATTAPTGWAVTATDITTAADATQVQTASSQTTATISGTTVSGDIIIWQARAY